MKFSERITHLIGYILQVTEYRYSILVLCDGVWFVPTCAIFAGPVTAYIL